MHGSLHDALTSREGWAARSQIHGKQYAILLLFAQMPPLSIKRAIIQQITRIRRVEGRVKMETSADYLARQPCRAGASAGLEMPSKTR